jgi:hypothetical protein
MKHQTTKEYEDNLQAEEWNAEHVITSGLDASKPSSGLAVGQLYWATDTKILYRATGATSWEEILHGDNVQARAMATSTFSTTSTSWVDVTGISVTINPPVTSNILVAAHFYSVRNNGGSYYFTIQRLLRDSTVLRYQNLQTEGDNMPIAALIEKFDLSVASGSHTYKLQGCVDATGGGTSYWDMGATAGYEGEIFAIGFNP